MKKLITIFICFCSLSFRQSADEFAKLYVVCAGASTDYHQLDSIATQISAKTGIIYRNDLVYDSRKGMIVPDTSNDEIYRGVYYPRRYAEERISIEMEGYYKTGDLGDVDSLNKKMIIVTGIFADKKDGDKNLSSVRKVVPSANMKQLKLYQGCMH